ncbi:MAG: PEP-CTERM sorting domain-containing protein [Pseudoalteromonas marina]
MNFNFIKVVKLVVLLLLPSFSHADIITLDFEGAGNMASLNEFYNGGTDSQGNSGVDYGISFGSNALSCLDSDAGGSCNIANEPTPDTVMFFTSGSAVLNYTSGFDTGFSFFYSSSSVVLINVYSGIDLTGILLGSISLASNSSDNDCVGDPTGAYCNWDVGALNFLGTAYSIDFGGSVNNVGFDNITLGSTNPNTTVPEPSSIVLFMVAFLGFVSRRIQRK